jgi:hypothetical protein
MIPLSLLFHSVILYSPLVFLPLPLTLSMWCVFSHPPNEISSSVTSQKVAQDLFLWKPPCLKHHKDLIDPLQHVSQEINPVLCLLDFAVLLSETPRQSLSLS